MIIEKVIMANYRQYRNNAITFKKDKLNLFIGKMGVGKSNLLNSITWCLYNEEPFLTVDIKEKQLPLLNLKTLYEAKDGEIRDVVVELQVKLIDNAPATITRKASFKIVGNKNVIPYKKQELRVKITDDKNNTKRLIDEEAEDFIRRIIPDHIKDFFFFNGERLENYFKTADRGTIHHSIYLISQTSLLNLMTDNLTTIMAEMRREAGEKSPDIEVISDQLAQNEKNQDETTGRIDKLRLQIKTAKENIEQINEKLSGKPEVDIIRKKIDKLKERKKEKENFYVEKVKDKNDLLFDHAQLILNFTVINKISNKIETMIKNKELPPTGDKDFLNDILHEKQCRICGTKFEKNSSQYKTVQSHLSGLELSQKVGDELMDMKNPLKQYKNRVNSFEDEINKISKEIRSYKEDLDDIIKNIEDLENQIIGYDEKDIAQLGQEKKKFEEIREKNTKNLGIQEEHLKELQGDNDRLKKSLDKELEKEREFKSIKRHINFADKSINIAKSTKENIMEKIRKEISIETEKRFFDLHWKEKSFSKVHIDEDYDISVKNKMDLDCLGTLSGGEREILALSFTMALHNISGFNAPVLIDRPLTMVSGEPFDDVSKAFLDISSSKQLIIFLTTNEYSQVSDYLNSKSCNLYELNLSQDEHEVSVTGV